MIFVSLVTVARFDKFMSQNALHGLQYPLVPDTASPQLRFHHPLAVERKPIGLGLADQGQFIMLPVTLGCLRLVFPAAGLRLRSHPELRKDRACSGVHFASA